MSGACGVCRDLSPFSQSLTMTIDTNSSPEIRSPQTAVLLIAHGSRRKEANDDLLRVAELITSRNEYGVVQESYLELAPPTIIDGGRKCVERGATRVLMLPYFLSAGVHVVLDLEDARQKLAEEFPQVAFDLCPHLGLHPLMADIVLARLDEGQAKARVV